MSIVNTTKPSKVLIDSLVGGKGASAPRGLSIRFLPSAKGTVSFDISIDGKTGKVLSTILEVRDEKPEALGSIQLFNISRAFEFKVS